MKNETMTSVAAAAVLAWSLGGVLAQESKKTDKAEAAKEARERDSSSKDRRVRIMKAFDRNKDGDLNEEEREALRRYIESRSSRPEGEKNRDDKIEVPKDYDPKKKYPFILSLHGYGSSSRGQLRFFPLEDLAEKHDFIYCAPDAIDRSWNATEACCDWRGKVDDSKYLRGLIEAAVKKFSIDRNRIYVTGLSNGGFMSYRMAHDHSDLIAAIVPFAGVGYKIWPSKPKKPVSVLHIHGTKDSTIKWNGGTTRSSSTSYPGAEENFNNWKQFNQCDREVDAKDDKIDLTRKVPGNETTVTRFENKDGSVTTELWEVVDGSHVTRPSGEARELIIQWLLNKKKS
jgi:polyhydroxybutyrate depolymerase